MPKRKKQLKGLKGLNVVLVEGDKVMQVPLDDFLEVTNNLIMGVTDDDGKVSEVEMVDEVMRQHNTMVHLRKRIDSLEEDLKKIIQKLLHDLEETKRFVFNIPKGTPQ